MTCATTTLPEAFRGRHQLEPNERFPFSCHPGVPCFNQCCSDVTILLTPADALRMARRLGMGTREFLDRHTLMPAASEVGLPVVMLRMEEFALLTGTATATGFKATATALRPA